MKNKVAIILHSGTETREGAARMVNAFTTAREMIEAGDEVTVILDGASVQWVEELAGTEHKYSSLFEEVRPAVAGGCGFCAVAFDATDQLEAAGIPLMRDYADHPSIRQLVVDGYQLIPF